MGLARFISVVVLFISVAANAAPTTNFDGATPQPIGKITESVSQIRVRFPKNMIKGEAFKVSCAPDLKGYSSWAANDTLWTYNFRAESQNDIPRLVGGSKCQVTQTADLKSYDGKIWKAGTINYSFSVTGPNVVRVIPAHDFNGSLREADAVVMILFDGPVDREKFFADQDGYISYVSASAPSEKLALVAVPSAQQTELFNYFKRTEYVHNDIKDRDWILATLKQNLIPGAQVALTIENQVSADNADVKAEKKFSEDFNVRSRFEAKVACDEPASKTANCLPHSAISVSFSGRVKWPEVKDAYIEYVPFKSTDHKIVRSYAELGSDQEPSFFNSMVNKVGEYVPFVAKFSDTLVDSVTFNVNIEPQTQAKIVLPSDLKDIDGRKLSNPIAEFHIRIGSMTEIVKLPQQLSFFEKNIPKLFFPVGVVNLNQKLIIRKTGKDANHWEPIRDAATMIKVIRAYSARGETRETSTYTSPMQELGLTSARNEIQLSGQKNRDTYLQFPFGVGADGQLGGLYPIEVSSPTLESDHSDPATNRYANPGYTLAQVTNLAVHLKKGEQKTVAWVTTLSDGQPVAGASLEIFNCLGEAKGTVTTDASGIAAFANQKWAVDCQRPQNVYSDFFAPDAFYVVAKSAGDMAMIHSSWISSNNEALYAPGMDYFYSGLVENRPTFHAVIGVNLVKPGQKVPVEVVAKTPDMTGFSEVNASTLPKMARVVNADDDGTYYEFPLTWNGPSASFTWNVPSDASVKLGRYAIELKGNSANNSGVTLPEDIEVAEFKVPLMSGIIAFPTQPLVQPDAIPVNSVIRYANGSGAKDVGVVMAYYFKPTSIKNDKLANFSFGSGPMTLTDDDSNSTDLSLPSANRPATMEGLKTANDGSLTRDIAAEKTADGRTVAAVLKTLSRPQTLVVRVRYQDQMGEYQTLSQAKDIFNAGEYVGTSLKAGDRSSATVSAAVVDVSGKVITSLADLETKIVRVETKVIGEEIYGGLIKNTVERELKPVRWDGSTCHLNDGIANCAVGALKEGTYAFEVNSKSSKQSAHTLFKVDSTGHVYGNDDYYMFGDESDRSLALALDKKSYRTGDKATVSFPAPFKTCTALVSIERADVMQTFVVDDACAKGSVQVPVDGTLAPNAFVSVYAITGRAPTAPTKVGERDFGRPTYRLGFANMKVDWSKFKSTVTVKTDKPEYKPGDNVNVQVSVAADEGKLNGGTVTLIAIEEKILELKRNDTYAILDALMQLRGHTVDTVTPLEKVETVLVNNGDLNPGAGRKGGNEGGDGSSKSDFKRKLFDALVSFQADVPVVNGVANFSFKANDSLTKFKVIAVAVDSAQKFGTGSAEYLSQKDTQSYSNLPSVAHTGDSYPVRITVQNNGAKAANFTISVTAVVKDENGNVIDKKTYTQNSTIDSSSSQAVEVGQMTLPDNAANVSYDVVVKDSAGNVVDAFEPPTQVVQPTVPLAVYDAFIYQLSGPSFSRPLVKDTAALPGKGKIRVNLANSLVKGAVDQIVSRIDRDQFAEFFIESKVYKTYLKGSAKDSASFKALMNTLLGYTDQHGFLKYYPEASTGSLWLTGTILNTLEQDSWTVAAMPAALKTKFQNSISQVLTKSVDPKYVGTGPMDWFRAQVIMARAAYAFDDQELKASAKAVFETYTAELAKNPAALGQPMEKWDNYDLLSWWLLDINVNGANAQTSAVYKQLTTPARLVYTGNTAQLSGGPNYSYFYSDETIESALFLGGMAKLKMDKDIARSLALGLANASQKSWYTDATLVAVAQGLRGFESAYNSEAVTGVGVIAIPEEKASINVTWSKDASVDLLSPWTGNNATVQITQTGTGKPWVGIQALQAIPLAAPRGQGLSVEKIVKNMTRETGFQTGDIIEVTINLHASSNVSHVAMMDPIPAGANIMADGYGYFSSGEKSYSGYKFYFAELATGVTNVKYQYQLNNPGTFKLPPTRAQGLYMPSVFGEIPNATMTVK